MTVRLLIYRATLAFGASLLALGVLEICAGVAGASETGRIVVQRTAVVSGSTIRLGDLATLEGNATALAGVDLGPAPAAGAPRRLEGAAILRRLQESGMDPSATRYAIPATVRVERTAQEVSAEAIRTAVLNIATDALPEGETIRDLDVAGPIRIPAGPYEARVSTPQHGRPGRRRFDVQLVQEGTVLATVPVTARTTARGQVVLTKQPVARGAVLTRADLVVEERDRDAVPSDAVTTPEQAIGMEARVALAGDAPLPRTALAAPVVVKKGDLVMMIVETPRMRLTAAGEALEAGAAGSGIRVKNRASKQEVAGKVIEHGLVLVQH